MPHARNVLLASPIGFAGEIETWLQSCAASGYSWAAQAGIGWFRWGLNHWGSIPGPALYDQLASQVPWFYSVAP